MGLASGSSNFWIIEDSNNETTATGPIAISLDVPMKAYISGGTTLVSECNKQPWLIHSNFYKKKKQWRD